MAKIDVYLKSIDKFGAAGAVLVSGQNVTLRFPTGDRHATQVTPHDALVALVREVAPPAQLDQIDKNRPARFDVDAGGKRYALAVTPRPGAWQVVIEVAPAEAAQPPAQAAQPPATPAAAPARTARAATAPIEDAADMAIERGQYDRATTAQPTSSGSALLDQLTAAARQARASDLYLACGVPPVQRVAGALDAMADRGPLDAETLSRELGIVAPGPARAAWTEHGIATFAYGDGVGRVRVTLVRDQRGPGAALRLLVAEPPALDRLGLGGEVDGWLARRGLVVIGGPPGSGKTTTLAALVRALGERRRRVVAIEDPIEIVHVGSAYISQRAIGEHAPSIAAAVEAAQREGADAIVVGTVSGPAAAAAIVDAALAGALVLTTIGSAGAADALDRVVDRLPADRRDADRAAIAARHVGSLALRGRSFEVVAGPARD